MFIQLTLPIAWEQMIHLALLLGKITFTASLAADGEGHCATLCDGVRVDDTTQTSETGVGPK